MRPVTIQRAGQACWRARLGDQEAGVATAHPGSEPGARFVRLSVDPGCRRAGVGRLLFEAVRADLLAAGCRTAEATVVAGSAGEAFAAGLGAAVGDELVDAVLSFDGVDWPELRRLGEPPPGYVLRGWTGRAPGRLVESYARSKRSIADAPNRHPPPVPRWDADLVRAYERDRADRQAELRVVAAVLAGTGMVVAFTEMETCAGREEASQVDTVVLAGHRRQGLATAVKARLLLRLHEARPDLVSSRVTCALANTGMRAVNHRLGFRDEQRRTLYRLELSRWTTAGPRTRGR
jgi:GNAT superfamily N-acetyltransferase